MNIEYHVTIIKTIKTVVVVLAPTASQARSAAEAYGLIEACSDFSVVSEDVATKIVKVVRAD